MLYPSGVLLAFVLLFVVRAGVSPYAAVRPLLLAMVVGLAVPWLIGILVGDRDRAGVLALAASALLLTGRVPVAVLLPVGTILLVVIDGRLRARGARRVRWAAVSRAMTVVAAVLLVAVGIASLERGRVVRLAADLIGESPLRLPATRATVASLPSVYLILLDGYPRADALGAAFGIDNGAFTGALEERGFTVAERSRSNHVSTLRTLASMFNGRVIQDPGLDDADYRRLINEGRLLREFRDRGYEVVAFSPGYEGVAVRRADRFVDSGQLNEFEWQLLRLTGLASLLDQVVPDLLPGQFRERILDSFAGTEALALEPSGQPRLVLVHVPSPHSPLILGPDGALVGGDGLWITFDDAREYAEYGGAEYSRRLGDQIAFLNRRTLEVVDVMVSADPTSVVVVFSDHGSGIHASAGRGGSPADIAVRTANLLAVRSPGHPGLIDDRSTLVNLLPRILRAYAGSGPPDAPEIVVGEGPGGEPLLVQLPD